jgi:hypothetical protein
VKFISCYLCMFWIAGMLPGQGPAGALGVSLDGILRDSRYRELLSSTETTHQVKATTQSSSVHVDTLLHPMTEADHRKLSVAAQLGEWGDHGSAILLLSRLVAKRPDTLPYVVTIRGVEYMEIGMWEAAESDLAQAVARMPHLGSNFFNYSLVLLQTAKPQQARLAAEHAIRMGLGTDALLVMRIAENSIRQALIGNNQ